MWLWTQVIFLFTINITRENMHEYLTPDMNLKKKNTDNCMLFSQSITVRYTLRRAGIVLGTIYLQSS